jgi:hypothetical protein
MVVRIQTIGEGKRSTRAWDAMDLKENLQSPFVIHAGVVAAEEHHGKAGVGELRHLARVTVTRPAPGP